MTRDVISQMYGELIFCNISISCFYKYLDRMWYQVHFKFKRFELRGTIDSNWKNVHNLENLENTSNSDLVTAVCLGKYQSIIVLNLKYLWSSYKKKKILQDKRKMAAIKNIDDNTQCTIHDCIIALWHLCQMSK